MSVEPRLPRSPLSTVVDSSAPMLASRPLTGGWLGVPTASWVRAAVLVLAFCAIYQYNLRRLYEKTNFINGDPNWYHAGCVPLIGLYYLLMRREELAATPLRPLLTGRFTKDRVVSAISVIFAGAISAFVISHFVPQAGGLGIIRGLVENTGYGLIILGALALVLDWGLATLLGGLALSAYGIYPGMNDFVWDTGMGRHAVRHRADAVRPGRRCASSGSRSSSCSARSRGRRWFTARSPARCRTWRPVYQSQF